MRYLSLILMQMKLYDFILSKSDYRHLYDPPLIMRPCRCYGLSVDMATDSIQNFKYNQKHLKL